MSLLQVQLQNFKTKIGVRPELEENGRLLHIRLPLGGYLEWTPLTYNLQVLREIIDENTKLRREIIDLMGKFVLVVMIRCNVLKPEQCMTFPPSSFDPKSKQGTWWAWLFAMLSPKLIQWPGTSFPNTPQIPGFPGAPLAGNLANQSGSYPFPYPPFNFNNSA